MRRFPVVQAPILADFHDFHDFHALTNGQYNDWLAD